MTEAPLHLLHHVCIVVHDLDKTQAFYERLGIGPWHDYPPLTEYTDLAVPNHAAFLKMRYRYVDLGNIQIQLCQPPEAPSPQRAFLDSKGEGVFQLGFAPPDIQDAETELKAAGLDVLMRGRRSDGSGFTYFDTAEKAGVHLLIRQASR